MFRIRTRVDRLLECGPHHVRPRERVKYYHQLQQVPPRTFRSVPLLPDALPVVSLARVRHRPLPERGSRFTAPTKWFVPQPLQRYTAG